LSANLLICCWKLTQEKFFMKKCTILSSLILSLSLMNSAHAVDPITTGVAAGAAAKVAAEGAAVATAAGVVGAGAAAAIASPVAGIAGGFGAAKVMNDQFFTECEENEKAQKACTAARAGTYTGAGLGTVGVLGAATAAGFSSAGLATIGGAIGGGAIAGAATLVAAPIVAAAAIGGATYWWFSRDDSEEAVSENGPITEENVDPKAPSLGASSDPNSDQSESTDEGESNSDESEPTDQGDSAPPAPPTDATQG
jgi:hypothetical protein